MSAPPRLTRWELLASRTGPATTAKDLHHLTSLLALERLAEAVYRLALRSPGLSEAARRLLGVLAEQERHHGLALAALVGVNRVPAPRGADSIQTALTAAGVPVPLAQVHGEHAWFSVLEELENAMLGAYYEALLALRSPRAATLAARVLASEAQHQTLLFSFRHPHDVALAVAEGLVEGSAASP